RCHIENALHRLLYANLFRDFLAASLSGFVLDLLQAPLPPGNQIFRLRIMRKPVAALQGLSWIMSRHFECLATQKYAIFRPATGRGEANGRFGDES
ncbi:MAG: hypothetical protein OXT06_11970, partial [Rhodospirillaceae bacterium]|nr:hypothetical protein [Rhodospirillaceae bacterium]